MQDEEDEEDEEEEDDDEEDDDEEDEEEQVDEEDQVEEEDEEDEEEVEDDEDEDEPSKEESAERKESKRAKKRRRKAEAKRVAAEEAEGGGNGGGGSSRGGMEGMGTHVKKPKARHLGGGLSIKDTILGLGPTPTLGRTVKVLYEGVLAATGEVFDKRQNKRSPLSFRLGLRQVVPGFDKGVQGMRVGGCREIRVPASMGYGSKRAGPIPPDSDLIFTVELLKLA